MNELFAKIYEVIFSINSAMYQPILNILYEQDGYEKIGVLLITIPFILWFAFYYFIKYPYVQIFHWRFFFAVQVLLTTVLIWLYLKEIIIYSDANTDILYPRDDLEGQEIRAIASKISIKIGLSNIVLSAIIGYCWVWILRHWSKQNVHLPIKYI